MVLGALREFLNLTEGLPSLIHQNGDTRETFKIQ